MDSQEDKILCNYILQERNCIHAEIKNFLFVVLSHFVNFEEGFGVKREFIANKISKKFPLLIKSLCQIHALYGYPATTKVDYSPEDEDIAVNPEAVREIFNRLKNNDRTLGDYHPDANADIFWQFESFTDFVREPAHILLKMMQDLFDGEDACVVTLDVLEDLVDGNYLKPEVWAEHKEKPAEHCGISLGVRSFVRPLYLYNRLQEIKDAIKDGSNGVKLGDVNTYQCVDRNKLKKNPILAKKRSKYKLCSNGRPRAIRKPCKSCKKFFDGSLDKGEEILGVLGNCAEYDVIKTGKSKDLVSSIENTTWKVFESACKDHLKAFDKLKMKTSENRKPYDVLKEYFESTRKPDKPAKVLRYKWISESNNYTLQAMDWKPEKSNE